MAGCYDVPLLAGELSEGFNPQPAIWPAATGSRPALANVLRAFQSPAGHMAGCYTGIVGRLYDGSTEFQSPAGHMAGCYLPKGDTTTLTKFQSPAGHMAGCYASCRSLPRAWPSFNPQPAIWPAATAPQSSKVTGGRRFNPQPAIWPAATCPARRATSTRPRFQSPAGHMAGCYTLDAISCQDNGEFQSPAGHMAGCYRRPGRSRQRRQCFNPQPAIWPAATGFPREDGQ